MQVIISDETFDNICKGFRNKCVVASNELNIVLDGIVHKFNSYFSRVDNRVVFKVDYLKDGAVYNAIIELEGDYITKKLIQFDANDFIKEYYFGEVLAEKLIEVAKMESQKL